MEETGTDGGLPTSALFFLEVRPEKSLLASGSLSVNFLDS